MKWRKEDATHWAASDDRGDWDLFKRDGGGVLIELNHHPVSYYECNRHVVANAKRYVEKGLQP